MLNSISEYLTPEHTRQTLAVLRWAFYSAIVVLVLRVCFHFAPYRVGHRVRLMLFPLLFAAGAVYVLLRQAEWQIAGFTRPDFVGFMERYNPRPDNAAHHLIRGSILDRNGEPLAYTKTDGSGVRVYPYDMAAVHAVGYRNPKEGLTSMERAADAVLSGYKQLHSWADFREAARKAMQADRQIGTNVTLTLDARLQMRAFSLLRGRRGAAVALDPKSGEVLLLCSSPAFDPNHFDRRLNSDPESPLYNRAIWSAYPAGSTFKTVIAALMVESGVPLRLDCPAEGYSPKKRGHRIHDHEYYSWQKRGLQWPGFGTLDLDTALAKSSNTYFAHGGVLCGPARFNALVERLRLNERVVLYSNRVSRLSSNASSVPKLGKNELEELAQRSIGQGTLNVTPLHMAMIAACLANGGTMMAPHLSLDEPPAVLSRPFSPQTAARVAAAMRNVVRTGTGRKIDLPGLEVCGKTGTAQNNKGDDHAWFICFAPASDPKIAVAVIVENAGFGSAAALPVAKGILEEFFRDRAEGSPAPPPPTR